MSIAISPPPVDDRSTRPRLATIVGAITVLTSLLYFVSDVIEVAQGGFSDGQLWLTLVAEAAIPVFVLGLAFVHREAIGRLGAGSAIVYAYAFAYFTWTVVYALSNHIKDYDTLTDELGGTMFVHGALMVVAGIGFGIALIRAKVAPTWAAVSLMLGVVLVAATDGLASGVQLVAAGIRDLGFAGMGVALLPRLHTARRRR